VIAALLPSRGLVHSRTVEAVDRELMDTDSKVFYTHDKPIPDCFNILSEKFLDSGADFAWFVEEDVVPPEGALKSLLALLESGKSISFINYPLIKFNNAICYKFFQDEVVWTGMGCTLVKREVFEKLERPWFKDKHSLVAIMSGSAQRDYRLELRENKDIIYGGQDVYFCSKAFFKGFRIGIVEDLECEHLCAQQ